MTTIYNSDLSKELQQGAKIQQGVDIIPNQLGQTVVPVMEVNPKLLRRINLVKSANAFNATSSTIYTTPTDKDFYLCSAQLSVIKDVTATSIGSTIAATLEDGTPISILRIGGLSLTVQDQVISISFYPMKLKRNTTITVTNTTNVANVLSIGVVMGYIVED